MSQQHISLRDDFAHMVRTHFLDDREPPDEFLIPNLVAFLVLLHVVDKRKFPKGHRYARDEAIGLLAGWKHITVRPSTHKTQIGVVIERGGGERFLVTAAMIRDARLVDSVRAFAWVARDIARGDGGAVHDLFPVSTQDQGDVGGWAKLCDCRLDADWSN